MANYRLSKEKILDEIKKTLYTINNHYAESPKVNTSVPIWFDKDKHTTEKWCKQESLDILKHYKKEIRECGIHTNI